MTPASAALFWFLIGVGTLAGAQLLHAWWMSRPTRGFLRGDDYHDTNCKNCSIRGDA